MIDQVDIHILSILKENSRLQWKEIGEIIHMTGQGVATRIHKMEELGIIEKYTLKLNEAKLGQILCGFIIVHMKSTDHKSFESFINSWESVTEAHRVSGNGCYLLKVTMPGPDELNQFIDQLLRYANYSLLLSIDRIKG